MKGPETVTPKCKDCMKYVPDRMCCRKDYKVTNPEGNCDDFQMRLADHYVPNPWDEWKKNAERKAAAVRSKSA